MTTKNNVIFSSALFLFLSVFSFSTYAQNAFYLGVHGGASIPNLTADPALSNPLNENYKSRVGPHFGILAEYQLSKLFAIQAEVNYSGQGGKRNGYQALQQAPFPLSGYTYATIDNTSRLNYLQIPIMLRANIGLGEKLGMYLSAGGFFGYMLAGHQIISGTSAIYNDPNQTAFISPPIDLTTTRDVTSDLHRTNVGFQGALGFSFLVGPGKLFIQGGGNYGFIKLQKDAVNGVNRTGAGTVTIGYALKIKGN